MRTLYKDPFVDTDVNALYRAAIESPAFDKLTEKISLNKNIYVLGNGGLGYVAGHMVSDFNRLVNDCVFHTLLSGPTCTSIANDNNFKSLFSNWIKSVILEEQKDSTCVILLSCSGKSENILDTLEYCKRNQIDHFFISGDNTTIESSLSLGTKNYHSTEVLVLMLLYALIERLGGKCPSFKT